MYYHLHGSKNIKNCHIPLFLIAVTGFLLPFSSPRAVASDGPTGGNAGKTADADVVYVKAVKNTNNTWTFHVTVRHPDTGWDDYVDGWDVVLPDGTVIKPDSSANFTRLLLHPHVNEQPFTRSQSGIKIPSDIDQVTVRAHDKVDGFGGKKVVVGVDSDRGENFEVSWE